MSDFKAKMQCTKIVIGWGSTPDPAGGAYDASPNPLVGWEGIGGASILVPSTLASVLPYHLYVRGVASVCVYCVNCTKLGQLILRIIIKIDATGCQIFRLKCTKIVFGWVWELTALPRPPSWIKGGRLLREGEGIWEGRGRGGKGGEDGREGRGREGRAPPIFYCTLSPPTVPVF